MQIITTYVATLIPFLILDGLWLGLVARNFYKNHIGFLMSESPQWWAAIVFYLLYIGALSYFVVTPHASDSLLRIFLIGAFFGLVAYATYDLTNQAVVKNWPLIVTVVDLAWGALLSGAVSVVAVMIVRFFAR